MAEMVSFFYQVWYLASLASLNLTSITRATSLAPSEENTLVIEMLWKHQKEEEIGLVKEKGIF